VVELQAGNRTVRAPVWLMPGHPDDSVTLYMGYGQALDIHPAKTAGANAYALQTRRQRWLVAPVTLRKTGDTYPLATTQHHQRMEGRDPVRRADLETYIKNPRWLEEYVPALSLYPEPRPQARPDQSGPDVPAYAWAMSINLNSCIGCGACTIACQAENNIPVVGKQEVIRGREMHWIRVDRYYENEPAGLHTYFQPVPCMHCENAPCEYVCPVGATVHDSEGLNAMIYNRCIGTRDCSQNCPYKVRRFNWLDYAYAREPVQSEAAAPLRNPDVTVRSRGVMEKCTYCVQRISAARREAKKENRRIREGEVVTACQAVCPTGAIVFGDLNNPHSKVVKEKQSPLDYALLAELNTRPRTTYKARIRNANPRLANGGESPE
jgi:molybdopterin-containing oxidoreductase family iron-sulfur binding subunit